MMLHQFDIHTFVAMSATKAVQRATVNDALEKIGFGKFNVYLLLVTSLVMFNTLLEGLGISYVLSIVNCEFKLNSFENGLLTAANVLGIISSSHLTGYLSDTLGRKRIIVPSLFMGFFMTCASSFAPKFSEFYGSNHFSFSQWSFVSVLLFIYMIKINLLIIL